jgi:hypothetical protein
MATSPNPDIYIPEGDDHDPELAAVMQQGKADLDPNNDLRDPWFHTNEGRQWLAERGERDGL